MDIAKIDELIDIVNRGDYDPCVSDTCDGCPLKEYGNCCGIEIQSRLIDALKRLKYLEKLTNSYQPKLPLPKTADEYFSRLRHDWMNAERRSRFGMPWFINWPIFDIFEKYAKDGHWGDFSESVYTRTINVLTRNKIKSVEQLITLKLGESEELMGSGSIVSDLIDSVQQYAKENS